MAFKMKRGSLKLGHNRQIKPIVTRFAGDGIDDIGWGDTPFLQRLEGDDVESNIDIGPEGVVYNELQAGDDPIDIAGTETEGVTNFKKCCPTYSQTPYTSTVPGCEGYNCDFGGSGNACDEIEDCGEGLTKQLSDDGKSCRCVGTGGDDKTHQESMRLAYTDRDTNILTPHQARRNQRMINVMGRGVERKKAAANRRVRKAIRRGLEPGVEDLAILSGATDSDISVFNLAEDSPRTRNMMGVDLGQYNQGASGRALNADEYRALESRLIKEGGFKADSPELYDAMKAADVGKMPRSVDIQSGKYMDNRTKRLYEKYGMDVPGGSTVSQGTKKLQGKLKRKGISANKKKRLEKRIKNRAKRGK